MLLQLSNQLAVLLHACSNELHILLELLLLGSALAILQEGYTVLCLVYLVEPVLNLVDGTHHVVQLTILLSNDTVE